MIVRQIGPFVIPSCGPAQQAGIRGARTAAGGTCLVAVAAIVAVAVMMAVVVVFMEVAAVIVGMF